MGEMNLNVGTVKGLKVDTNIKHIKVPEQLRKRHKCGIDWVDDAFGGEGFVPSSVHMLTGMPATGKSTFIRQLADSLTGQGHVALYNSGEENLYQVAVTYERLRLRNGFICADHDMTSELLAQADQLMAMHKGKQVFLLQDSLQTLNDGKYKDGGITSNTPVRCCEMLTSWAKATFGIVIFIGQCNKNGDYAGKNTIKHAVDGHAELYFDNDRKSETFGERMFGVTKNRWGVSGKTYIVELGERGLSEKGSFKASGT